MSLVKICGLSTPSTLQAALIAGADLVGFVFFERSPRHVSLDQAAALGRHVKGRARTVALTVDAGDEALDAICRALRPDFLQLHGLETPERVARIKDRYGLPVMKAFGVAAAADLAVMKAYAGLADWFLLDARPPEGALLPGGNGLSFDWRILADLDRAGPIMLSGGLDASNVAQAIRLAGPNAVDVSSGVEERPGEKNADRIRVFVAAARAAFADARHEEVTR
jgi:phosphoribosylanthranilate isomerase